MGVSPVLSTWGMLVVCGARLARSPAQADLSPSRGRETQAPVVDFGDLVD